jgi:Ser/Thr protein kinase RdoA (MazF antagonist)
MPVDELVAHARAAFGWTGEIHVSAGPRGALGQVWRVEVGSARYALKELFDEPRTEASIAIELDFARRATEVGVRVPASHSDRACRHLLRHRDRLPENVHLDSAGTLVVVDWDDMGAAEPGQELARAVFDWFCDDTLTDLDAARVMVQSYLSEGGPGRVTEPSDFSMLLASRLNFLLSQVRLEPDPKTPRPRARLTRHEIPDWGEER